VRLMLCDVLVRLMLCDVLVRLMLCDVLVRLMLLVIQPHPVNSIRFLHTFYRMVQSFISK
jgi:hypothetical protein